MRFAVFLDIDGVLNTRKTCGSSKCMGEYDVENLFDGDWDHKEV